MPEIGKVALPFGTALSHLGATSVQVFGLNFHRKVCRIFVLLSWQKFTIRRTAAYGIQDTLPMLERHNAFMRYAAALLALAVGLTLGRLASPLVSILITLITYGLGFLSLAFASWYCGIGPSAVVAILELAALKYWLIPPVHTFRVDSPRTVLGLVALTVVCGALIAIGEVCRRESERLRLAQGELEERVRQRTAELDSANHGLRELTARLMQLQDEERRRIARELHDSVGQTLAALTMNLTTVSADIERLDQTAKTVRDSLALAQEMNKEVRTVSYLLHPPLLDESGLASALRWYVDGFSQRSKIQVKLEICEDFGRLPQDMETALFRTVQECLTNIHRHSGSPIATIRLDRSDEEVRLRIEDRGAGIPREKLDEVTSDGTPGVGIRGMRERLRQLGGSMELESNESGTTVKARLPIRQSASVAVSTISA